MRRRTAALVAAVAAGATTVMLFTPGEAVGKNSTPQGNQRIEICFNGKTLKVSEDEVAGYLELGANLGPCPRG
jgi:hypothetical protein